MRSMRERWEEPAWSWFCESLCVRRRRCLEPEKVHAWRYSRGRHCFSKRPALDALERNGFDWRVRRETGRSWNGDLALTMQGSNDSDCLCCEAWSIPSPRMLREAFGLYTCLPPSHFWSSLAPRRCEISQVWSPPPASLPGSHPCTSSGSREN